MNYTVREKRIKVRFLNTELVWPCLSVSRSACLPSNFEKPKWVSFDLQFCWSSCLLLLRY